MDPTYNSPHSQKRSPIINHPGSRKNDAAGAVQQRHSILILEDERLVAENLKLMLEESSYDVVAMASSGREAIQMANATDPDLLLMDIRVHGDIDGIQTAILIREAADKTVPIVFLTAYSPEQFPHLVQLESSSFVYLTKPYTKENLLGAIDQAFRSLKE